MCIHEGLMRTDGLDLNSTMVESKTGYHPAQPDPRKARPLSTSIHIELVRSVMTRRTAGIIVVRIGLAEFPTPERSTNY